MDNYHIYLKFYRLINHFLFQLYPDKHDAEILHKFFPKIYKNDNHKPELFIALSDFELHFGFVSLDKAV